MFYKILENDLTCIFTVSTSYALSDSLSDSLGFTIGVNHLPAVAKYTAVPINICLSNISNNHSRRGQSGNYRKPYGSSFPAQDFRYADAREVR